MARKAVRGDGPAAWPSGACCGSMDPGKAYALAGFVGHSRDGGAKKGSRSPDASQVRLLPACVLRGGWRPNRRSTHFRIYVARGFLPERATVLVSTWVEQRFGSVRRCGTMSISISESDPDDWLDFSQPGRDFLEFVPVTSSQNALIRSALHVRDFARRQLRKTEIEPTCVLKSNGSSASRTSLLPSNGQLSNSGYFYHTHVW